MDSFIKELEIGDIHLRDLWQFELKSEFFPLSTFKKNTYTQEFYLFIPNSLQMNEETYNKSQFYRDQTNLIRYKTPEFQLKDLYDKNNDKSPLFRLSSLRHLIPDVKNLPIVEDELKLLGNIIRSALRERIRTLTEKLRQVQMKKNEEKLYGEVKSFCEDLEKLRKYYLEMQSEFLEKWSSETMQNHFLYLDEFISNSINYYLTGYLERLRKAKLSNLQKMTTILGEVLAQEKGHRKKILQEPAITDENSVENEFILYRSGLLNKFILDALLLNTTRSSLLKRFRNLVGSISAGIAMLFFFVLFVWQGEVFIINSIPFILITVFLYIIKDRMKEGLKTLSYRQFAQWFSDYITDIRSSDDRYTLGRMTESFSFVGEEKLPKEITRIRNREFHAVLEAFKRPEHVIYYKKKITMFQQSRSADARRNALNIIFRFNISQFLRKADDPIHEYVTVAPQSLQFIRAHLPKVYHLNIIMKNTYIEENKQTKIVLKKFRVVIDKNGIKRIEHVPPSGITNY